MKFYAINAIENTGLTSSKNLVLGFLTQGFNRLRAKIRRE